MMTIKDISSVVVKTWGLNIKAYKIMDFDASQIGSRILCDI